MTAKENGEMAAYPQMGRFNGLTKRELFAAMALQGFAASSQENTQTSAQLAAWSIERADALLAELAKEKTE